MASDVMFPKPTKRKKSTSKREPLNHNHQTHSRKKIYRFISKPTYLAGLAAGQGLKGQQPVCERCQENTATQIHHQRGRVGAALLNYTEFTALCGECHEWVHAHPSDAMLEGWLKSRHAPSEDQDT